MAISCSNCGSVDAELPCKQCGHDVAAAGSPLAGNAITWPFLHLAWASSLWIPLFWFFPPFGSLLSSGWAIVAIRRISRKEACPLPQSRELATIFGNGFIVLVFFVLYFVIPLSILGILAAHLWVPLLWEFLVLIWKAFFHSPHQDIWAFVVRNALVFLSDASAPAIYLLFALPLFLVARLRYARTGQARSFVKLFSNAVFCLKHAGDILKYFFFVSLTRSAFMLVATLLAAVPILGQLLPFVLGAAVVWMSSFWAAEIAEQI